MSHMRRLEALLVVMLAVLALGLSPAARAGSAQIHVFPPQAHPYGYMYSEWEVRFVQWWTAIPKSQDPFMDRTGADCAVGQSGPVWYLVNNEVGGHVGRTCTVPAGKALSIMPGIWECSAAEGNGSTEAALRSCAKGYMDQVTKDTVTVDGVPLTNLLTRYRFETPLFTFRYPAHNVLDVPGPGTSKSVADAVFVILSPLAAGRHTVELHGVDPALKWDGITTYHLTIGR